MDIAVHALSCTCIAHCVGIWGVYVRKNFFLLRAIFIVMYNLIRVTLSLSNLHRPAGAELLHGCFFRFIDARYIKLTPFFVLVCLFTIACIPIKLGTVCF